MVSSIAGYIRNYSYHYLIYIFCMNNVMYLIFQLINGLLTEERRKDREIH